MESGKERRSTKEAGWPRKVGVGRNKVTVYRRVRADSSFGYEVANYSSGRRRLESFPDAEEALERARSISRLASGGDVIAASLSKADAAEYASALQSLGPYRVSLSVAASTLAECLRLVGDLPSLREAAMAFASRRKHTIQKPVAEVISALISHKKARHASDRYIQTLEAELGRFGKTFSKAIGDIRTAEVQEWLGGFKISNQTYINRRRIVNLLFNFAAARGYATENPVTGTETVAVGDRDIEVFTPGELQALLNVARPEFVPCIALGAFAGLRSAEIQRLEWEDIRVEDQVIVVGAKKAKTATRRTVPIQPNLAEWLKTAMPTGSKIWDGTDNAFHGAQKDTAKRSGVGWKANALRHSYASYRFAIIADAGRVAAELGNSASVVNRHSRELVRRSDAEAWFGIRP